MARPCSVCTHPDRPQIEIGLANGIAARVLALRYGLDPDALRRHKKNCRFRHGVTSDPKLLTKALVMIRALDCGRAKCASR